MGNKPNLDEYVDVRERMSEFFKAFPEGSFQSDCSFTQVNDRWVAVVKASAYRYPDDPRPGHGLAYEFIPGLTAKGEPNPYVYNSELQNAETAAWGRAVIAVGAGDSKKPIASREEVRNRTAAENVIDNLEGRQALRAVCAEFNLNADIVAARFEKDFEKTPKVATNDELFSFSRLLRGGLVSVDPEPTPA